MLIARRVYDLSNVLSPKWWAFNWVGLSGRAYNRDFLVIHS